jgi:DNA-binding NarL/FixJ family response regulator
MKHYFPHKDIPVGKASVLEVCLCGAISRRFKQARSYYDQAGRPTKKSPPCTRQGFTATEITVINYASEGWNPTQIAKRMNRSLCTIYNYQFRVITKLKARNLTHALVLLMRKGVIK